jgi:hypothetical protein
MAKVKFTALYDWLARRRDLNSTEKMIISHILRYGRTGCYKSNKMLAGDLGIDKRTLGRAVSGLVHKDWIAQLYETRRRRVLFINELMLDDMPLFESMTGCGKPVRKPVKSSKSGWGRFAVWWGRFAPTIYKKSKHVSYNNETILKEQADFLSSKMKQKTRLTKAEFEARRQEYHRQLEED